MSGAPFVGDAAPPIGGVDFTTAPATAVWFYKITCPVCQMAAPKAEALARAFPGRVVGVGQDPPEDVLDFGAEYGLSIPVESDSPPYPVSEGYGIETVPTTFVVDRSATIVDAVVSWDRDGYNRVARTMATMLDLDPIVVSDASDGLPAFRPG